MMALVKIKLPAASNWFVATGSHCAAARLVATNSRNGQLLTPPEPLTTTLPLLIIKLVKAGEVSVTTDSTPDFLSRLVFQTSLPVSVGKT